VRRPARIGAASAAALVLAAAFAPDAPAQGCPAQLNDARRLVLVTADGMNTPAARMQLFERAGPRSAWRAAGPEEPAMIGRAGMGWSQFHRALARPGEPIKVEGDKRAPAGIYAIGPSFGSVPSSRPGHIPVTSDTICVHDPRSPAYNSIVSRRRVGPNVAAENMSRIMPMYRRGLVVDYPTDARARAGSCIFIHVWQSPKTPTAGCVALPEARVVALQAFAQPGATLAILPHNALGRLRGCMPGV
jgi:L,D-peptidoglycan transpeptidase YkuD (ErfK/YbiS/YcfS/YnhG family)